MLYFIANMEVFDTTSPSDFDVSDSREFSITYGPFSSLIDALDNIPTYGVHFILEFKGIEPRRVAMVNDYELVKEQRKIWTSAQWWSPSNLYHVFYDTIQLARWYQETLDNEPVV